MGFFHILLAFVALVGNNEDVMVHSRYAYQMNVTTWGWIHLVTGVAAVVIGIGLFLGWRWAYALGLLVAFISALDNFAFLPHAPVWSAVMLAFDVLVIWALVQELREPD
jgi:polyferredoxin